ncbi:hypothetical protein DPMN_021950 [Dreissena polymorpha]|uniref:B box-type domain-containing protein n=1 Tax=Dreissena polymorpha TaxID=45954 RepID=A0A9D4NLN9_DREPO|nr:hypothetical protein DPMN_021950 [Dreissena polymorpha]
MTTCSSDEVRLSTTELCDPCFNNCKEILAVLYCLDCDEKFSEVCGTCHKKSKLSKDHKLSKVAEAPPGKIVKLLKELTTCPNHQSEEVVYICIDEDQLFCSQCANTRHRKCGQLETIEQYMVTAKHEQTIAHPMTYAPQEKSEAEENHVHITKFILPEKNVNKNTERQKRWQLEENLARRSYYSYGAYPNPQVTRNIPQMHQFERPDGETSAAKNI